MDIGVLVLLCLNFAYIALLPVIFFRKSGKLTWGWFLTALPFGICPLGLVASYYGYLPRLTGVDSPWGGFSDLAAVLLSTISISLISYTLGTHKIPISLWHQENDAPQCIVTYGAYQHIRHPFYTSFLIAFVAAFIYAPQMVSIASLLYALLILNKTAQKEEEKLCQSDFAAEYKSYIEKTGRFLPKSFDKADDK